MGQGSTTVLTIGLPAGAEQELLKPEMLVKLNASLAESDMPPVILIRSVSQEPIEERVPKDQ